MNPEDHAAEAERLLEPVTYPTIRPEENDMGRKTAEARLHARLSNHNDDQDELDRESWEKFLADVRELAGRPQYADIEISVDDYGTY